VSDAVEVYSLVDPKIIVGHQILEESIYGVIHRLDGEDGDREFIDFLTAKAA
jgi:hypothetical protein